MTGSNRRPSACKADALPAELILRLHLRATAWRRPTLTGGIPQLPSALKSLTSVFGMGTGVTSLPLSPDSTSDKLRISSLKGMERIGDSFKTKSEIDSIVKNVYRLSPRSISICQLHVSPHFHLRPINLIIFQGSYFLAEWEISS